MKCKLGVSLCCVFVWSLYSYHTHGNHGVDLALKQLEIYVACFFKTMYTTIAEFWEKNIECIWLAMIE